MILEQSLDNGKNQRPLLCMILVGLQFFRQEKPILACCLQEICLADKEYKSYMALNTTLWIMPHYLQFSLYRRYHSYDKNPPYFYNIRIIHFRDRFS